MENEVTHYIFLTEQAKQKFGNNEFLKHFIIPKKRYSIKARKVANTNYLFEMEALICTPDYENFVSIQIPFSDILAIIYVGEKDKQIGFLTEDKE